jgi:hypothetical protein
MSIVKTKPLHDCATAWESISEMCRGFADHDAVRHDFTELPGSEMPEPYRSLLVHNEHMTHALRRHHGCKVDLYIMERHHEGDLYSRKIFLNRLNTAYTVELGLVRLDLRYVAEEVRRDIVAAQLPLGAVLTRHNVLRRIEPKWFLHFPASSSVLKWFGNRDNVETYGRLGTIYCNHEPAVEVLEIVTGT